MNYRKFAVLFSLILFFCGCAATSAQATRPPPQPHQRPVGFWQNKEAVVQVIHFYNKLDADDDGKPILDANGKLTTNLTASVGTGAVVDINGLVLTNNQVIKNHPIELAPDQPMPDILFATPPPPEIYKVCRVTIGIQICYSAEVVATDAEHDLAQLHTDHHFPRAVEFVDDSELVPGDEIYFWGNVTFFLPPSPFFGHYANRLGPPYYTGTTDFSIPTPLLFMDVNLNFGSSGSPVFNEAGKCIGIGEAFITEVSVGGRSLGIIIPSSTVNKFRKANPWPRQKKK